MSLGVLCPGQGAQHPAMLDILSGDPAAEAVLNLATLILGSSVREILTAKPDLIHTNVVAQPLICAVELATWAMLATCLPAPCVFAGYSVGELAAYGCAGALSPFDVISLADARAQAMEVAFPHSCRMAAVRDLSRSSIERLARANGVYLAIINGEDGFVVGGRDVSMTRFETMARASGACLTSLPVYVASHTPLMELAAAEMRRMLEQKLILVPAIPVLAGVDGMPVRTRERAIATLCAQIASPIDWAACLQGLLEAGCTAVLELGPGADLARMVRRRFPDLPARSVSEFRTAAGIASWVQRALNG